jgi:Family of unknown function (DUF6644)
MTLASVGRTIQDFRAFTAIRESSYVYPVILSTHVACIALFGGLILLTNLRLLEWSLTDVPVHAVIERFRPWKQLGFVVMAGCGSLLAASRAAEYFVNPFFQTKMALLAAIGVHGTYFRRSVYRSERTAIPPGSARAAAILSLALWIAAATMGRWIAYYDVP